MGRGRVDLSCKKRTGLHGPGDKNKTMWIFRMLGALLCLAVWAESLGDGYIKIDHPERWPDKYRLEMIIGGF